MPLFRGLTEEQLRRVGRFLRRQSFPADAHILSVGEQAERGGRRIPLRLSQSDLASLIGASRPRVNQILAFYRERGYIALDQRYRITILDIDALTKRAT